jgi:hypothetical protein
MLFLWVGLREEYEVAGRPLSPYTRHQLNGSA